MTELDFLLSAVDLQRTLDNKAKPVPTFLIEKNKF